ncbi:MAG: hypothetical protein Q4C38_01020 [bacterium]|nr:hypothetical protein [bacterium]
MNNELAKQLKNITPNDFYKIINSDGNNEIKDWLAKLGSERIDEMFDPSLGLERAINYWRMMGYSQEWIKNKLIEMVNKTSK